MFDACGGSNQRRTGPEGGIRAVARSPHIRGLRSNGASASIEHGK